ncbi:MAG: TonB-dependent receptor [Ginsengibacter sp.]
MKYLTLLLIMSLSILVSKVHSEKNSLLKEGELFLFLKSQPEIKFAPLNLSDKREINLSFALMKGKVVDENGEPLQGVNVTIKGNPKGAVTNSAGDFSIEAKTGDVLVFSFIGFISKEIKISKESESLTVSLSRDQKMMDQVVVIGYGEVKRRDLTGSVSTVKSSDIVKSTDMSLNGALQGRAAGVQVVSSEGAPGANVSISIRAGSSISASNDPLYVIDGFPSLGGSNLNINPNDIESVEILKDASATAIYGSRGANGVIIITTKSGKSGKFNVSYDGYYSIQQLGKKIPVLNTLQYAGKQHYISANPRNSELGDSAWYNWPTYNDSLSTNWQDRLYKLAGMQSHNISFTGGTGNLKIAGSFNVTDQDGIAVSTNYKRFSGRVNTTATINKVVTSETNISLVHQDRTGASLTGSGGLAYSALRASPFRPPGVDFNQYLQAQGIPIGGTNGVDPMVDVLNAQIRNLDYFASVNSSLSFKLLEGLTLKIAGGVNFTDADYNYYYPSNTSSGTSLQGVASKSTSRNIGLLNENTLNFTKSFNQNNRLSAVAGMSFQTSTNTSTGVSITNFAIESLGYNNLGLGSGIRTPNSNKSASGIESYFGRAQYTFHDRYLFTGTIRADGSSKFPIHKWGYFPSGAFAWKIDEEKFMKSLGSISTLKLRLSYGATGNESVAPYSTYTTYGPTQYGAVLNDALVVGVIPRQLGSDQLKWETTVQKNIGLDLGLFKDRVVITADAYQKDSRDLLLSAPLSVYSGFTTVTRNIGNISVKGIEVNLNTVNLNGKLGWTTNFNIASNKNKVISLNEGQQFFYVGKIGRLDNMYIVKVGKPLGSMFGYLYDGISNTQEELAATPTHNFTAITVGTRKYKDISGKDGKGIPDGVVDANDRTAIGNGNPKFFGGFSNDFSYGSFELSVLFTYSYGNDIVNGNKGNYEQPTSYQGGPLTMLDRWTPEDPQMNKQRWNTSYNAEYDYASTWIVEDGSYLRLKNIQLAYNVNEALLKKLSLKRLRVYATAQNLLTFTHYTGYDPEVNFLNSIITPGADLGAYPRSKIYTIGLNVSF